MTSTSIVLICGPSGHGTSAVAKIVNDCGGFFPGTWLTNDTGHPRHLQLKQACEDIAQSAIADDHVSGGEIDIFTEIIPKIQNIIWTYSRLSNLGQFRFVAFCEPLLVNILDELDDISPMKKIFVTSSGKSEMNLGDINKKWCGNADINFDILYEMFYSKMHRHATRSASNPLFVNIDNLAINRLSIVSSIYKYCNIS